EDRKTDRARKAANRLFLILNLTPMKGRSASSLQEAPRQNPYSVSGFIVDGWVLQRLMRRHHERKDIQKRHVIRVHVVAEHMLVRDEVQQCIDRVIARATTVRKTGVTRGRHVLPFTRAAVAAVQV